MIRIAILGGGALGVQIAGWLSQSSDYSLVGFYDDVVAANAVVHGQHLCLGSLQGVETGMKDGRFDQVLIAVGYNNFRFKEKLFRRLVRTVPFATFVHHTAFIGPETSVGRGVVVYPSVVIDQSVTIEDNVLLNISAKVCHDSKIGEHSFLAPASVICGNVTVGRRCFIGANAVVNDGVEIADDVIIGSGTTVTRSIDQSGTYVGSPVRRIK